jgi:hypothetical protein
VPPARFERATYALGGRRAIQLCHGDIIYKTITQVLWWLFVRKFIRNIQQNHPATGIL